MPELLPSWDRSSVDELRPFARACLVAVDLDGTLKSAADAEVYSSIAELQRRLRLRHPTVTTTLATGRALAGVRQVAQELELASGTPMVLYNGSVVARHEQCSLLCRRCLQPASALAVARLAVEHNLTVLMYSLQDVSRLSLFGDSGEESWSGRESVLAWGPRPSYARDLNGIEVEWHGSAPTHCGDSAVAALIERVDDRISDSAYAELVAALRVVPGVSVTESGSRFLEVRPAGADKASALQAVCAATGVARDEVVAVGDNDNDVEMLLWAGLGVAVKGASEAARLASDYCSRHGASRGVVEVLRLIRYARRYWA